MSSYTRNEIILFASARIDEVIPQGENLDGQISIEAPMDYIEDALDVTGWELLQKAPKDIVMDAMFSDLLHFHGGSIKTTPTRRILNADNSVTVVCPDNYLRLLSIQLSDSERPITELLKDNDPKRKLQYNRHTRGTKYKPVGALVSFSEYITSGGAAVEETDVLNSYPNPNKAIQIWSTTEEEGDLSISHFHYVGKMVAEDLPDTLIEPLVWLVASRALAITKRFDVAKVAREEAASLLNELKGGFIAE